MRFLQDINSNQVINFDVKTLNQSQTNCLAGKKKKKTVKLLKFIDI